MVVQYSVPVLPAALDEGQQNESLENSFRQHEMFFIFFWSYCSPSYMRLRQNSDQCILVIEYKAFNFFNIRLSDEYITAGCDCRQRKTLKKIQNA